MTRCNPFCRELLFICCFFIIAVVFYAIWWVFGKGTLWAKSFNVIGGVFYFGSIPWSGIITNLISPLIEQENSLILRLSSYSIGFTINAYLLRVIYKKLFRVQH